MENKEIFYIEVKDLFVKKSQHPLPPRGDAYTWVRKSGLRDIFNILRASQGCTIIIDRDKFYYNRDEVVAAYREIEK